jgi:hypothetical protein
MFFNYGIQGSGKVRLPNFYLDGVTPPHPPVVPALFIKTRGIFIDNPTPSAILTNAAVY